MYTLHEGWRPKSGSPPLIFGSAVHKALETFYLQPIKERGEIPHDFDEISQSLVNGYEPPAPHFLFDSIKAFIQAGEQLKALPDSNERSLPTGVWMLCHYFRTYFNDVYVAHADEHGPMVERTFEVVLVDTPTLKIILFGTIDLVLRNIVTNGILPGDHKTSSRMGSEFFNRVKPNHQYTGYVIGAQRALGLDTEDFLVNGLQVKVRPKKGMDPQFSRQITKRNAEDIKEFTDVVEWNVRSYLAWQDSGVWPLGDVNSCAMYGGCGLLDVCSSPNSLRQNILEAKYVR